MMNDKQHTTQQAQSLLQANIAAGEIIIGELVAINQQGQPMVNFELNPSEHAVVAITTLALNKQHLSRQVVLLFNQGDLNQPIIMGLIHSPLQTVLDQYQFDKNDSSQQPALESPLELSGNLNIDDVKIEGKKITFEAQDELEFKCGESSITLTKAGKVLIRGKYLLNRSSGVNRIMGGSVQVN